MKIGFKKILSALLLTVLLFNTVLICSCDQTGEEPEETTQGGGEEGGNPESGLPTWLFDIDEKLAAQANEYGRNMSAAIGGYDSEYPLGSQAAIRAALELGVDAIGIYIAKTKDGTVLAMPSSSLGDFTDIDIKGGQNGLPRLWRSTSWTIEQIGELRIKNADGTSSDYGVLTFDEVVELCADKCFVYILNLELYEEEIDEIIYPVAKKHNAYKSFVLTPGVKAVAGWEKDHPDDSMLAAAIKDIKATHMKYAKYIDGRQPLDHKKSSQYGLLLGSPDSDFGWRLAAAAKLTFWTTGNLEAYVKWIVENFRSALEYTPTAPEFEYSLDASELTGRYLLVSDIHYVMAERGGQKNRVEYRGYTNDERMEELCNDIRHEYELRGLDAIFILGDLSTDDYYEGIEEDYWTGYTKNACKEVYEKFFVPLSEELGIPVYITGGNHDSHSNEVWREFSGRDRQYVVDDGQNVIIVCDTYDPADGNDAMKNENFADGNDWTDVDGEWLEEQLEKYKDRENVFVSSHWFGMSAVLDKLVAKYDNVVCMFDAHGHHYLGGSRFLSISNKLIINTGTYSYGNFNGDFGELCSACGFDDCAWGFQILETTEDHVVSYRVDTGRRYTFSDGTKITVKYKKYPEIYLK